MMELMRGGIKVQQWFRQQVAIHAEFHWALTNSPSPDFQMTSVPLPSQPWFCTVGDLRTWKTKVSSVNWKGALDQSMPVLCNPLVSPPEDGKVVCYRHQEGSSALEGRRGDTLQVVTVRQRKLKRDWFSKAFPCPILPHPPPAAFEVTVVDYCLSESIHLAFVSPLETGHPASCLTLHVICIV